jgi:MFS family permease
MANMTAEERESLPVDQYHSPECDIRGLQLLHYIDFWILWIIMGALAGVGLMTINNIGSNASALYRFMEPSVDDKFLNDCHQYHVSVLSVASFAGRLFSGLGSDFLAHRLQVSRLWCLALGSLVFVIAQICAFVIRVPQWLAVVSGLSGLAYGFVFGVLPSIIAERFGVRGLSQNWGLMTFSPVLSGYAFNLFYGSVYDGQSVIGSDEKRICFKGLDCYRSAYGLTLIASLSGLLLTLGTIKRFSGISARGHKYRD